MVFFTELRQIISKSVWKHKKSQIAETILRKKNRMEESTYLISDYSTKLQSSRQYGPGTKTEI